MPVGLAGFTTPLPPDPDASWTGISWHRLDPGNPLALIRSITRWRGGYVAVGKVLATGEGSRTPVWVSTDGATWVPLPVDVLGPEAIVVGVGETANGVAAVTLQGGPNQCNGDDPLFCWSLAAPLQAWMSTDGTTWTSHAGPPALAVPSPECDTCGVDVPILRAGTPGLFLFNSSGQTAISADGTTWEDLPAGAFPAGFQLGDVAAFGLGFIAVGEQNVKIDGQETIRPVALSSSDGRGWELHVISTATFGLDAGETAAKLVAGPHGLIALGSTGGAPGVELWWSSTSGTEWRALSKYPPLGVWTGDGVGSGAIPNGLLVGDGQRMLAYRDGKVVAAWMSSDGRSWRTIHVTSGGPTSTPGQSPGLLRMTPIGVLGTGNDLSSWFGQPTT
jgi:hypothetical protein